MNKLAVRFLIFWFFFVLSVTQKATAQIYYHNFGTTLITSHPYTTAPTTIDPNLSGSSWTSSTGAFTSNAGATGQALMVSTSAGTTTLTLSFTVAPTYEANITSFSFWRQRSGSGPQNWSLEINATTVGSGTAQTAGAAIPLTNVSTPVSVQGNVTVKLILTNATGGNFRLDDFRLNGSVTTNCNSTSITSFSPATGPQGTIVTINGTNFTGATSVKFGTASTTFTIESDNVIKAVAPAGGTGAITVTGADACAGIIPGPFTLLTSSCSGSTPANPEIYISEVYDQQAGSGGMIELYNPGPATINFNGNYVLQRFGNIGDTTPTAGYVLTIPGSIGPGMTYLLGGSAPDASICAAPPFSTTFGNGFNGNDKFELLKNGVVIDRVHVPYTGPGYTLKRKPDAVAPTPAYNVNDWNNTQHPLPPPNNYCADLGSHTIFIPTPPTVTQPTSKTICENGSTTFTVALSAPTGYTYRWKTLNASGNWVDVANNANYSGAATPTLTITNAPAGFDGNQYYCEMISSNCNVKSYAAQLYISPAPQAPAVAVAPISCGDTSATLTVTPATGLTYSLDGVNFQNSNTFTVGLNNSYTVTIKNSAGCTASANINVGSAPIAPATPNVAVSALSCGDTSATLTVTPATGLTYSLDGVNFQNSNTFTVGLNNSYNITIKNSAGCTASANINVGSAPIAPATPNVAVSALSCGDTSATLTVTPATGLTYSLDGVNFQNSNTFIVSLNNSYTVTVKNSAGCTASANVNVGNAPTVPATPNVAVSALSCGDTSTTLTVTPATGLTYSLDGVNFQNSNTFIVSLNNSYTITVKNSDGCTTSTGVTVGSAPSAPATPNVAVSALSCGDASATLTVTPATGLTYSLDGVNFQNSNTFTVGLNNSYTVTVKNSAGCTASANVNVGGAPSAPATPNIAVSTLSCGDTSATLTVTPSSGLTYSLDGVNFQNSNTFTVGLNNSYTVTVKNSAGCTASANVNVGNAPSAPATPNVAVSALSCGDTSATLTVTPATGLTYSLDGISFQNSNTFTVGLNNSYTVTVKNSAGCTASANINVGSAPIAPAAPSVAISTLSCGDTSATLTVTPAAGLTYSLDGVNFQNSNTFTVGLNNSYTITIKNSAGCTASANINVGSAPIAPATPNASTTHPGCGQSLGTITISGSTGFTYSINNGVTYQPSNIFNIPPGTYNVRVKNASGCESTAVQATINNAPPQGNAGTIAGNSQVCENSTLQLSNTVSGGMWASSNTAVATIDNNGLVTGIRPGNVTITYSTGGPCPATTSRSIRVNALPDPQLRDNYFLCVNPETGQAENTITLNTGLPASGYSFAWVKNGTPLTAAGPRLEVGEPGQYSVTVTNTATGCTASAAATVGTSSIALAGAEVGEDFDYSQTIRVNVMGGSGDYQYRLDDGPFQDDPVFRGSFEGEYTITVKDTNGCGEITLTVFALNYPRFFTPNGDGMNETWNINGLSGQRETKLYIFDRFGKLISVIRPGTPGWNGTYNGRELPATDYWFTLEYVSRAGVQKEFMAHFSLKR